eukprot:3872427-Pleurochrysis_carterae.AAC.2
MLHPVERGGEFGRSDRGGAGVASRDVERSRAQKLAERSLSVHLSAYAVVTFSSYMNAWSDSTSNRQASLSYPTLLVSCYTQLSTGVFSPS